MLEIVITGRHDDYGGADFFDRLCAAADHNHRLLEQEGVEHRYTLVEWNPIEGRALLADLIRAQLPWWHHSLIIDPVWHERLSTNPRLQFMEFFAKNAAVRRSTAHAILTTNTDVFLSTDLARALARKTLDDRTVYRATRVDIDRHAPWQTGGERTFADPNCQLRVNDLQPPQYGNSAGDFLLLTKRAWMALGGFNERVRFAKIHKDGQFCVNAQMERYAFDVLGPIYHIDHDGSYANAGAMRGSPDAPYGPEWNYWSGYRNPQSWGLTASIDEQRENDTIWVRHPSTHGPILSVIECREEEDGAAEAAVVHRGPRCEWLEVSTAPEKLARGVNAALADARGKFVLVTHDVTLADFGGCDALVGALATADAGLITPPGALMQHSRLGAVPAADTPYVVRRDVVDALVEWDESALDPALVFWLGAIERTNALSLPGQRSPRGRRIPAVSNAVEVAVLTRRGARLPDAVLFDAVRESLAGAGNVRGLVEQWLERAVPDVTTRCALVGPDWATGLLLEILRERGQAVAGVFTSIDAEVDTCRWGERLRPLADLRREHVTRLVAGNAGDINDRLAELDVRLPLLAISTSATHTTTDSDLDILRRAQSRDLAARDIDAVLTRLPLLCGFEGERRWNHRYDAAQACEKHDRADVAKRLYREVMRGAQTDVALRMRATFHTARLLVDDGRGHDALPLLQAVLAHNPAHGAARQMLDGARVHGRRVTGVAV